MQQIIAQKCENLGFLVKRKKLWILFSFLVFLGSITKILVWPCLLYSLFILASKKMSLNIENEYTFLLFSFSLKINKMTFLLKKKTQNLWVLTLFLYYSQRLSLSLSLSLSTPFSFFTLPPLPRLDSLSTRQDLSLSPLGKIIHFLSLHTEGVLIFIITFFFN